MSGGRKAQFQGTEFEKWVEGHHEEALRLGIVAGEVVHNESHGKIINGQWVMVAPGVADYTGVLYDGHGTTFAAEAKSYKERLYRSDITVTQQRHLDAVVRGGGMAFLLARFGDRREGTAAEFCVPWQSVPWVVEKSAESVTARELAPWRVPAGCRCYLERYCPVRGVPTPGCRRVFPRE